MIKKCIFFVSVDPREACAVKFTLGEGMLPDYSYRYMQKEPQAFLALCFCMGAFEPLMWTGLRSAGSGGARL